jgi:hypothetical protein
MFCAVLLQLFLCNHFSISQSFLYFSILGFIRNCFSFLLYTYLSPTTSSHSPHPHPPTHSYHKNWAAATIQRCWRTYRARKQRLALMRRQQHACRVIQVRGSCEWSDDD